MPTIDDELIQNAKAVFNSQVIINSANDLKTKDGSSIGGSGDQANWINYHVEIKAGGPVTIKDPINIEDYTIYGRALGAYNMFRLRGASTASSGLKNPHTIESTSYFSNPAMYSFGVIKLDKTGEIIKQYGNEVVNNYYKQVVLDYGESGSRALYDFKNPAIITDGDYTLTVIYGVAPNNSSGNDGFMHITSDLNSAKIHMVVSTNETGQKSIKMAEGETGLVMQYVDGTELGDQWYIYLLDVQLTPGWTA